MLCIVVATTEKSWDLCPGVMRDFRKLTLCNQVAILSYNHNNLAEPALNGLNLYAKPLP